MSSRRRGLDSSVGEKIIIGATGFALFLYLIIHITANLTVFGGAAFFNESADVLERIPILPVIEVGLLLIFVIHVYKTVTMFFRNQRARPTQYAVKKNAGWTSRKSFASSTMIVTGSWLLVFLIIHVKAFKYGPQYEYDGMKDFYRLEMENLSNPFMVAFYVLSMLVVGSHLWHGASSSLQSLGLNHPLWTPRVLTAGKFLAVAIAAGFIVIAIWAYLVATQVLL